MFKQVRNTRQRREEVLLVIRKLFLRMYWMPAAVFMLGLLSILTLICVDRINEIGHRDINYWDAVMDMRIRAGSAYLAVQDASSGDTTVTMGDAFAEIDLAMGLIETILNGGTSEHGQSLQSLEDPELRKSMEGIRSLLTRFKSGALQLTPGSGAASISRPVNGRFHALFKEIRHEAEVVENALQRHKISTETTVRRLLSGIFFTWIFIIVGATAGLWSREKGRGTAEKALRRANEQLQAQTAELTNANLHLQQEIMERKKTEQSLRASESQLRHLSFKLLTAQEAERRRISRELHDELGGSLAALKMGLSRIAKGLREDQAELREQCSGNSEAIDLVIDNVYRLSRNLSPHLLEEFGLSAALKRLVSNFGNNFSNIKASLAISGIDHQLPEADQIVIYRIIQEALTNVGKHSKAGNVSVSVERQDSTIVIVVEDDGKGFAVGQVSTNDPLEKGMGLTTMDERARMLGGTSHLWSQEGKGTRLTFTIPVREEAS
jgi:signal transduction histidine kinase